MSSNWAEEFRRRVEESEGRYGAAENFDDADEEEEEVELEEPQDEAEEEAERVEQGSDEVEIEKPPLKPLETTAVVEHVVEQEAGKLKQQLQSIQKEVERKRANEWAGAGAMIMAMMGLSFIPPFYQAVSQAFQPFIQRFSSQSHGSQATSQEWVTCLHCGYQCLGYNGMPCPCCGRS